MFVPLLSFNGLKMFVCEYVMCSEFGYEPLVGDEGEPAASTWAGKRKQLIISSGDGVCMTAHAN